MFVIFKNWTEPILIVNLLINIEDEAKMGNGMNKVSAEKHIFTKCCGFWERVKLRNVNVAVAIYRSL